MDHFNRTSRVYDWFHRTSHRCHEAPGNLDGVTLDMESPVSMSISGRRRVPPLFLHVGYHRRIHIQVSSLHRDMVAGEHSGCEVDFGLCSSILETELS